MKEIDNDEVLRELKRLHSVGFLKNKDLVKKLEKIIKEKENLKTAISKQKAANMKMVAENFSVKELQLLINSVI